MDLHVDFYMLVCHTTDCPTGEIYATVDQKKRGDCADNAIPFDWKEIRLTTEKGYKTLRNKLSPTYRCLTNSVEAAGIYLI